MDPTGRVDWSATRVFLTVFLILFPIYLATASVVFLRNIDASTNAITAWSLVRHGTPVAVGFEGAEARQGEFLPGTPWIVESDRGPIAQYPPGAALTAAPVFGAASLLGADSEIVSLPMAGTPDRLDAPLPPAWVGGVAGALTTSIAAATIAVTVSARSRHRSGLAAGLILGLGTSAWLVAGTNIWQHGPAMMWLAIAVALADRDRLAPSGLAFAMAVLVRPHAAVIAACVGIAIGLRRRSVRPIFTIGLTSSLGLLALVGFNWWAFGSPSIVGGYGGTFSNNMTSSGAADLGWFAANVGGGLFDSQRGLVPFSPFLLALVPGLREGWRRSGPAGRGAAIGGVLYLLIQWKANRFSGGNGFWAYRYPLETLAVCALLGFAAWESLEPDSLARRLFRLGVAAAVAGQIVGFAYA